MAIYIITKKRVFFNKIYQQYKFRNKFIFYVCSCSSLHCYFPVKPVRHSGAMLSPCANPPLRDPFSRFIPPLLLAFDRSLQFVSISQHGWVLTRDFWWVGLFTGAKSGLIWILGFLIPSRFHQGLLLDPRWILGIQS